MNQPKNILIVRTDRIGDVVLSIPMASAIKKSLPETKVSFLVRSYTAPLLKNHPAIDKVLIVSEKNGSIHFGDTIKTIKQHQFDFVFTVYPKALLAFLLFFSKIPQRVGTGYRWYSFLFNEKVYVRRKSGKKHEIEYNMDMLDKLGIKNGYNKNSTDFHLYVSSNSLVKTNEILSSTKFRKEYPTIIVHPGSGGSAIDLPLPKIKKIVKHLSESDNCNLIITGSESEKTLCNSIANEKSIDLSGKFNLEELVALISKADILIANSTGPIHIAAALNKYVVGFYPKIHSASPTRWGPYTNSAKIFQPNLKCSNCTRKQCEELDCMNTIKVEEVLTHVKKKIEEYSTRENL